MRSLVVCFFLLCLMTTLSFATPELINVSPNKVYLGNYCTLTGRYFDVDHPENNQVILNEKEVSIYRIKQVPNSDLIQITIIVPPDILPEPPTKNVELTIKVITNGEASNTLPLTIVPSPFISSINPNQAYPGDTVEVELEGFRTSFRAGRTSVDFGPDISVESLEVIDRYHLHIVLNIDENAEPGLRDVKVRYGRRRLTRYGGFEVLTPPSQARSLKIQVNEPQKVVFSPTVTITGSVNTALGEAPPAIPPAIITSVIPSEVRQGESYTLRIQGENTHFDQENSQLILGEDIELEEFKVLDASTIEAKIKVGNEAKVGERNLQVITGTEIAQSVITFKVRPGYGTIKGYLRDEDTGQVIVGALVSIKGTTLKVYTDENGYFELKGVPAGDVELVINAPNYGLVTLSVNVKNGETVDFTKGIEGIANSEGIRLKAKAILPGGPLRSIEALVANGATSFTPPADYDLIKQIITDTIITVGGSEMGVLDEDGNQLNPNIEGEGICSFKPEAIDIVAEYWMMGRNYNIAEILLFFTNILEWKDNNRPTLDQWLVSLNNYLSRVWNDNNITTRSLAIVIFNKGKEISPTPPVVSSLTNLNPLQTFIFINSFLTYLVDELFLAKNDFIGNPIMLAKADNIMFDMPFLLLAQNESSNSNNQEQDKKIVSQFFRDLINYGQANFLKNLLKISYEDLRDSVIKGDVGSAKVVEIIVGRNPIKTIAQLIVESGEKTLNDYLEKKYDFDVEVKFNKELTWKVAAKFAGHIMKYLWSPFIQMYKIVVTETATPMAPIIQEVKILEDDDNLAGIKIVFARSATDLRCHEGTKCGKKRAKTGIPRFWYKIYRKDSERGFHLIYVGTAENFKKEGKFLYYIDQNPPFGMITYYISCRVQWRKNLLTVIDFSKNSIYNDIYQEFKNRLLNVMPSVAGVTSGVLLISLAEDMLSAYSEVAAYFYASESPLSQPVTVYYNLRNKYNRIDVASVPSFLSLPYYNDFVSVPSYNYIYVFDENKELVPWAEAYFAPPHQKGLAVDIYGNVYSENAASEDLFGGKIFRYISGYKEGIREDRAGLLEPGCSPWFGRVVACSKFRLLDMGWSAPPVQLVDMCYGYLAKKGEYGLFILNQTYNDIRFLRHDIFSCKEKISLPLSKLGIIDKSDEFFVYDDYSRVLCYDRVLRNELYFTYFDKIYRIDLITGEVEEFLSKDYFLRLSGIDSDRYGNIYFSDYFSGMIYVIPSETKLPILLFKLNEDFYNPIDLTISNDQNSMIVATESGVILLPHLIPFKIVNYQLPDGGPRVLIPNQKETQKYDKIEAYVKEGYLLYPADAPSTAREELNNGHFLIYNFDKDSNRVYISELTIPITTPESTFFIIPDSFKDYELILDRSKIYKLCYPDIQVYPQSGQPIEESFCAIETCMVPKSLFNESLPKIFILSPLPGETTGLNVHLVGAAGPNLSKVAISINNQDPITVELNETGCFTVDLNVPSGINTIKVYDPDNPSIFNQVVITSKEDFVSSTIHVTGFIVDPFTGAPRKQIRLELKELNKVTYSDSNGFFIFKDVYPGTYTLRIGISD